jgi:hypothetical protein
MTNKKLTLQDFYNEILLKNKNEKLYINDFLDYCKTFNINFFSDFFFLKILMIKR